MLINKLKFKFHILITYNRKEINRTEFKSNLFYLLVNKLNSKLKMKRMKVNLEANYACNLVI